jgi:hypothetical protein
MKNPKQKKQLILLFILSIVLACALYYSYSVGIVSNDSAIPAKNAAQGTSVAEMKDFTLPRNPRRTGGKKELSLKEIDPTIHLEKLNQFDPGTPLNARNMFSLDSQPAPQVSGEPSPKRTGVVPGTGTESASLGPNNNRPPTPLPVVINLKFFGVLSETVQKQRQGFFADGDEVYLASEGALVGNRYRIVRIGDSTAEVEEITTKTRRQLNLVVQ